MPEGLKHHTQKRKTKVSCGLSGIKRVKKKLVFVSKPRMEDTIINIPLNGKGLPEYDRVRVEERRMIHEGYHTTWRIILKDKKDRAYLRLIME